MFKVYSLPVFFTSRDSLHLSHIDHCCYIVIKITNIGRVAAGHCEVGQGHVWGQGHISDEGGWIGTCWSVPFIIACTPRNHSCKWLEEIIQSPCDDDIVVDADDTRDQHHSIAHTYKLPNQNNKYNNIIPVYHSTTNNQEFDSISLIGQMDKILLWASHSLLLKSGEIH